MSTTLILVLCALVALLVFVFRAQILAWFKGAESTVETDATTVAKTVSTDTSAVVKDVSSAVSSVEKKL